MLHNLTDAQFLLKKNPTPIGLICHLLNMKKTNENEYIK